MKNQQAVAADATALPAYQRIKNYVLEQIQRGIWQEGDLIPTELSLCKTFDVSRMTVNRALRELTADQVLVRYKGSGTYVAQTKFQSTLVEIRSIAQDIRERGHQHSSQTLLLETVEASETQALRFRIAIATRLFHSVLVHYENEVPIQIEDRIVHASVAPDYLEQDWQQVTPNEYLMRVAPLPTGNYTIEASLPTKEVADILKIPLTQPCLLMDRATFSKQVFTTHAIMWYPGNRYKFSGQI